MQQISTSSLPAWIRTLGTPAWIVVDGGTFGWMNSRAEKLLGKSSGECMGKPCHQVVRGFDLYCRVFCKTSCYWKQRAEKGLPVEPFVLRVGGADSKAPWCQVLPITWEQDSGPSWFVHCVLDLSRAELLAGYLSKVASRTPHRNFHTYAELKEILTERELEVLALLAKDDSLRDVASEINVSYTTVRNHVQHIMTKLETHTIQQAVALYLLAWDRA